MIEESSKANDGNLGIFFKPRFQILHNMLERLGIDRVDISIFGFRPTVAGVVINLRSVPKVLSEEINRVFV